MKITRRVLWLPAADDGCALWRMHMIHLRYPGSGYILCDPGVPMKLSEVNGYQVAVVQRLGSDRNIQAIKMLQQKGLKVVYDLDDNIWAVPKYNPAYKIFRDYRMLKGTEECARAADFITTSTEWLCTVVKRHLGANTRVEVVENALDFDLFYRARKPVKRPYTVIGWAGTPTHHIDLAYAMNALATVMRQRQDLRCEFLGGVGPPEQIQELINKEIISKERVSWHAWISPREYPAWISNLRWDIAMAPLSVDNEFNKSKSNIKILEAAALGIPCLASPTLEYKKFCQGNPVLEHLLCNKTEEWIERINEFVNNPDLRISTAAQMDARAKEKYNFYSRVEQVNKIYESI